MLLAALNFSANKRMFCCSSGLLSSSLFSPYSPHISKALLQASAAHRRPTPTLASGPLSSFESLVGSLGLMLVNLFPENQPSINQPSPSNQPSSSSRSAT